MRTYRGSVAFGLAVILLFSGCSTMMLKERQVTKIRADGEGAPFDATVEQESAQHLSYRLVPVIGHFFYCCFPPLALANRWEIRRKEVHVYSRGDAEAGVREDREIKIRGEKALFSVIVGDEMKHRHEVIFKYVMGLVDTARRGAGRQVAIENVFPEKSFAWCKWVGSEALGSGVPDQHLQKLLVEGRDAELADQLRQEPYTVEAAALPSYTFTVTITYTEVNVETGEEEIKVERKTYTVTSPPVLFPHDLINPNTEFTVQIARHFSDLKSDKALGGVKETYHLRPEQTMGSAVSLPLLN
ncbi:MAG TPA: hypothetical protein P5527_05290 [Kiritimatiellia bacterium]|nr:hypothetical protein [Kiritimatiellia bacterium]